MLFQFCFVRYPVDLFEQVTHLGAKDRAERKEWRDAIVATIEKVSLEGLHVLIGSLGRRKVTRVC